MDSGMDPTAPELPKKKKTKSELQEALYSISRVQEATAQQERLVSTGKFADTQRNNIRMAINMMLDNYRLVDQVVVASRYAPVDKVMLATSAGNEAVENLEMAKDYFSKSLKVKSLTGEQKSFILQAMQAMRQKLDDLIKFMPAEVVTAARRQVEDENELNAKEFMSDTGTMINPVKVPWKA